MEDETDGRTLVLICYALHLVGAISGLPSLIALVLNYLKTGVSEPTADTHHRWMIRTFWWAVLFACVGGIMFITVLMIPFAYLLWLLVWMWYLYRHIKGILALMERRPMPL